MVHEDKITIEIQENQIANQERRIDNLRKQSREIVKYALGDKVLLSRKEAGQILHTYYDLIWISGHAKSIDDMRKLIDYNVDFLQSLCIDKLEEFYNIDSWHPKLTKEQEQERRLLIDKVLEKYISEEREEIPTTYATELEALEEKNE